MTSFRDEHISTMRFDRRTLLVAGSRPGTAFLRGSQAVDDNGIVEFLTLYPGWYPGRAVHIHLRVHIGDSTVLTSQLFFDDEYSADIFTTGEYESNGQPNTLTGDDSFAGNAEAEGTLLSLSAAETDQGAGTLGLLNLGIDPTAISDGGGGARSGGGGGGGGGGGRGGGGRGGSPA
jgi:uncharacterized membrane protein YgcG